MAAPDPTRLAVARFLPDIELPSAEKGTAVPLRPSLGRTTVLVSLHSAACERCLSYLSELASARPEFEVWDARLIIAVPAGAGVAPPPFGTVVIDAAQQVSSPDDACVVVADRYGHIYEAAHAGAGHHFPPPRQLEEWLKFLGTQCPE